ncbi:MAG: helix-turn-helix transcriptional regulator [Chloroflexota bacterium]|nr:helix-turn-helix transcriptional regulator [Chloroflexota bacterium]
MAKKVRWGAKQLRLRMAADLGREVKLEEISEKTGIDVGALSRIENNKHRGVRFETLEKLAEFYQLDNVSSLLIIEDKRRTPVSA